MAHVFSNPEDAKKTLPELIVKGVEDDKGRLAKTMLDAFAKGDPTAIKYVTQALLDSQFSEENQLPITDARFKEIVCLVADAVRAE